MGRDGQAAWVTMYPAASKSAILWRVTGIDGDGAGGFGVHGERVSRQAGRVDRAEPRGFEGDRGDLLATVEHFRVEDESEAVARVTAGNGGDAGQ